MAEEKELELEDVSLEDKGSSGGSRKTLILMGVGALVLILISVGLTLFLLKDDSGDSEGAAEAEGAEEAVPEVVKLEYVSLKPFTVNFQHGGRTRLLQVQLSLSTRSTEVVDALKLHEPLVNHTIITLLGGREFESLRTTEGKEALRKSLLEAVQDVVQQETGDGSVENVLFTRFVMQ